MSSKSRLLTLALLASVTVVRAQESIDDDDFDLDDDLSSTRTNFDAIKEAITDVHQQTGAPLDARPNLPPASTFVTTGDNASTDAKRSIAGPVLTGRFARLVERTVVAPATTMPSGYTQVFDAKCKKDNTATCKDAAIMGTGYLTYTLVNNGTYSVGECLNKCENIAGCVFANIYYEYNNPLLDWVFSEKSNLKCVLYSEIHYEASKTNDGGQTLIDKSDARTYIQESTGWAKHEVEPATPAGYERVEMPLSAANNAPTYMGYDLLSQYDPAYCAQLCNTRYADGKGGVCQYFNIWRAENSVDGATTSYTCAMYFTVVDPATAVNTGDHVNLIKVTKSRGYARISLLADGSFESFSGAGCKHNILCYAKSTIHWVSSKTSWIFDTVIVYSSKYARTGKSAALLGSGSLSPTSKLKTVAGKKYIIQYFQNSSKTCKNLKNVVTRINWNGNKACEAKTTSTGWTVYWCTVTAKGNDVLAITGGASSILSFLFQRTLRFVDDITVFGPL